MTARIAAAQSPEAGGEHAQRRERALDHHAQRGGGLDPPAPVDELVVDVAAVALRTADGRASERRRTAIAVSASGSPTISGVADPHRPVRACRARSARGASRARCRARYAPPSPRYMRAGGALKTRNAASAPASASPTVVASPPRIANAAALTMQAPGREPVLAVEQVHRVEEHDARAPRSPSLHQRRARGPTSAAATPITISAPRREPRREAAGVVDRRRARARARTGRAARAGRPRSGRRAGRGTPRRRRGTAPGDRCGLQRPGPVDDAEPERDAPDDRRGDERDDQRDDEFHTSTSDDTPSWTSMRGSDREPAALVQPQRGDVVGPRDHLDRVSTPSSARRCVAASTTCRPTPRPPASSSTATARISAAGQVGALALRRVAERLEHAAPASAASCGAAASPGDEPVVQRERPVEPADVASWRRRSPSDGARPSSSVATYANESSDRTMRR